MSASYASSKKKTNDNLKVKSVYLKDFKTYIF